MIMEDKKSHDLAVCKVEIQKECWCNSVRDGCNSEEVDVLAKERVIHSSSSRLFWSGHQ